MIPSRWTILAAALAVALAGCAADTATTDKPLVTPSVTPSVTPVVTPSTMETPTHHMPTPTPTPTPTGEEPGEEEPQLPPFLDCETPAATTAAPGVRMGYPEIVFTVKEGHDEDPCFGFVGPANVTAGWTAVTLTNNGHAPHIMPMFMLPENKTFADFISVLKTGKEPEWATAVGGIGVVTANASATSILNLTEGRYVIICFFEGHDFQGMYRELTVLPAEGEARAEPVANFTIEMVDFSFVVPKNLTAGSYVVRYWNNGTENHEAPLIALNANTTTQQFLDAVFTGEFLGKGVGGANEVAPGASAYTIVDLVEGEYGLLCFVSSHANEDAPHFALGMLAQFAVGAAPAPAPAA